MAPERSLLTQHNIPSSDGLFIASIQPGRLVIRSAPHSGVLVTYRLPHDALLRCKHARWARLGAEAIDASLTNEDDWLGTQTVPSRRILLSDDENIRIYDPASPSWRATITSASGNLGSIAQATFGFSHDEVLVFSEFGLKLTIWSLITSRGVEIRDPKYNAACYSFRPKTGHLALLTRSGAQDVMMVLKPGTHTMLWSTELSTVDAQEVAWSTDGRWLAVSDAAGVGYKVLIYTSDGQLYKTWIREREPDVQLGVKSMMWTSNALALGDYDDELVFLKNDTFAQMGVLSHTSTICTQNQDGQKCWEEQIDVMKGRSYSATLQSVNPPDSLSFAKPNVPARHGVSTILFNADESMVVTKSDSWPTTAWIWSATSGRLVAALIHHSPVKHVEWHPRISDMLLVQCMIPEPVVHVWKQSWEAPEVIALPLQPGTSTSRFAANWLLSPPSAPDTANIMLSTLQDYVTMQISITDGSPIVPLTSSFAEPEAAALSMGTGPEDMFDEGHSLDFSPVKISNGVVDLGGEFAEEGFGVTADIVDDTFHYRKNVNAGGRIT